MLLSPRGCCFATTYCSFEPTENTRGSTSVAHNPPPMSYESLTSSGKSTQINPYGPLLHSVPKSNRPQPKSKSRNDAPLNVNFIESFCLTLRLSCGARTQPRFRHRPPARRQLQPVVRRPGWSHSTEVLLRSMR